MQVRTLMRSPVVTVGPDESLQQAATAMQEPGTWWCWSRARRQEA
jgi:CBS domain-containing protein